MKNIEVKRWIKENPIQDINNPSNQSKIYRQIKSKICEHKMAYFNKLVTKNQKLVISTKKELQKMGNQNIVKALDIFFIKKASILDSHFATKSIEEVFEIIKKTIKQKSKIMEEAPMTQYENILKNYYKNKLNQNFQNIFKQQLSVSGLFKLDIISLMLKKNLCFQKNDSKVCARLITLEQIGQLLELDPIKVKNIESFYLKIQKYLNYCINTELQDLFTILQMLKVRFRINNFMRTSCKRELSVIKGYMKQQYTFQEESGKENNSYEIKQEDKFHFCQLFYFLYSQQKVSTSPEETNIHHLQSSLTQQQSYQYRKRQFLFLKYNLKLKVINQQLTKINNLQEKTPQKQQKYDLSNIQKQKDIFKYRIIKNYFSRESFQQLGLQQAYGLKTSHLNKGKIIKKRQIIIAPFAMVANQRYQLLTQIISMQLQMEKEIKPFMCIKKFVFSYSSLKGLYNSKQKKQNNPVCSLILATMKSKIQYFCISRENIQFEKQARILKKIPKKLYSQFTTILFEYKMNETLNQREYQRLISHFGTNLTSRMYITNSIEYSQMNIILFKYLQHCISQIQQELTKQNFHQKIEGLIQKRMREIYHIQDKTNLSTMKLNTGLLNPQQIKIFKNIIASMNKKQSLFDFQLIKEKIVLNKQYFTYYTFKFNQNQRKQYQNNVQVSQQIVEEMNKIIQEYLNQKQLLSVNKYKSSYIQAKISDYMQKNNLTFLDLKKISKDCTILLIIYKKYYQSFILPAISEKDKARFSQQLKFINEVYTVQNQKLKQYFSVEKEQMQNRCLPSAYQIKNPIEIHRQKQYQ